MDDKYLKKQIITYMGNKRKILGYINEIIDELEKEFPNELNSGDGFSGSGIVSRLLKKRSSNLYVNDLAGYSQTLNQCYLSTPSKKMLKEIKNYIDESNKFADNPSDDIDKWVQKYWSPIDDSNIKKDERVYFTSENGKRIDAYRFFINKIPKKYQCYLLSSLLIESSIHNNTNGQFSGFYKKDKVGCYGGKTGTDVKRITQKIELKMPILNDGKCNVFISRNDTNKWIDNIPELDIMYYDPPYNKHPYNIYYFLLDIINDWDLNINIPNTYRGQPKDWVKSGYNSKVKAFEVFEDLIKRTKAKYILISYNNDGIISNKKMEEILNKYGILTIKTFEHKTYNRLKGIANYKRVKENKSIKEVLYLLKKK